MSGLKRTTEKTLMVFSGRANPQLAENHDRRQACQGFTNASNAG